MPGGPTISRPYLAAVTVISSGEGDGSTPKVTMDLGTPMLPTPGVSHRPSVPCCSVSVTPQTLGRPFVVSGGRAGWGA